MIKYDLDALEYISKLCDGHLRDAITMMDKCLAYSTELTLENVVKTLGTVDFAEMFKLTDALIDKQYKDVIAVIENIHADGKDVKQFIRQYTHFLLDIQKYVIGCDWKYINIPRLPEYEEWITSCDDYQFNYCKHILEACIPLNANIKYSANPKLEVEATFLTLGDYDEA